MASFQEKVELSIAASPKHKHVFHQMHLTTGNFMQFDLAFAKEIPAKSNGKINHQSFIRTMPLKKPVMGSVQFHKSAYFVPFRTVWEAFTSFLEDSPHVQSEGAAILTNVPLLSNNGLIRFIVKYCADLTDANAAHDFSVFDSQTDKFYRYNTFGRHVIKLLNQLGYRPMYQSYDVSGLADETFSALPLLSIAKVYIDYFYPVQYAKTGYYINLEGMFRRNYIYTLSEQDLLSIFRVCYLVSYSSDYFVSAFDNPVGGSDGTVSTDFILKDLTLVDSDVTQTYQSQVSVVTNGTPVVRTYTNAPGSANSGTNSPVKHFTQFEDDMLKALTNYIRRHQLSSSRSLERYLADWGIALSADKLQRCYKLTEKHYPLQVADITSTSDTYNSDTEEGAQLGDYAGKGVAYNQDCNFEFDTDEFGMLIIVNTIVPDIAYYQGIDRNVLHKTKLDFLTGDFDGKLITPILQSELFVGNYRASSPDSIFGFLPAYAEYATTKDVMSGDFTVSSLNVGLLGWSTVREFSDDAGDDIFDVVHNLNFVLANDFDQYNRIFLNSEDNSDKFIMVHRFNAEIMMPKVPLYDYYDFEDGKKKITMQVNGVKSN